MCMIIVDLNMTIQTVLMHAILVTFNVSWNNLDQNFHNSAFYLQFCMVLSFHT